MGRGSQETLRTRSLTATGRYSILAMAVRMVFHHFIGSGWTSAISMTAGADFGLRTLSGGQFSFQVEAFLAIETGATPDLIVASAHSVRDVFAVIRQAPVGGPVELTINQNGALYCSLTIADGWITSNSVPGAALPPLIPGARLSLDITMVGPSNPGADLTVIIRL